MLISNQLKIIKEKEDILEGFLQSHQVDTGFLNTEKKHKPKLGEYLASKNEFLALGNDAAEQSANLINEISRDLEEIESQFVFDKRSAR